MTGRKEDGPFVGTRPGYSGTTSRFRTLAAGVGPSGSEYFQVRARGSWWTICLNSIVPRKFGLHQLRLVRWQIGISGWKKKNQGRKRWVENFHSAGLWFPPALFNHSNVSPSPLPFFSTFMFPEWSIYIYIQSSACWEKIHIIIEFRNDFVFF